MALKTQYPFVPNMDDCRMVVRTETAACYIMDTCCKNMTEADKMKADREIVRIYLNAALRKKAQGTA